MSVQDVDFSKVFKVLAFGALVWLLSALALWSGGAELMTAVKVACGVTVGWISGNLAETGLIMPSVEGLKK